jgi:hypothetical protein
MLVRLLLPLTVALCLLPARGTAQSPRNPAPSPEKKAQQSRTAPARAGRGPAGYLREPLLITPETDVRLDGKPCPYAQIPDGAVVTAAEVAADRHTVLRVHFRSPK